MLLDIKNRPKIIKIFSVQNPSWNISLQLPMWQLHSLPLCLSFERNPGRLNKNTIVWKIANEKHILRTTRTPSMVPSSWSSTSSIYTESSFKKKSYQLSLNSMSPILNMMVTPISKKNIWSKAYPICDWFLDRTPHSLQQQHRALQQHEPIQQSVFATIKPICI